RDSLCPAQHTRGNIVIAPGSTATRGSAKGVQVQALNEFCGMQNGPDRDRERSAYLYVWGAIRYDDGFKRMRTTRFCHRYNWVSRRREGNRYVIDAADARYHEFGNAAN